MFRAMTKKGECVFSQGDKATCFFILERGKVDVFIGESKKRSLQSGEGFGELALLYNAPRSATIKCDETTYFWVLERKNFKVVSFEPHARSWRRLARSSSKKIVSS